MSSNGDLVYGKFLGNAERHSTPAFLYFVSANRLLSNAQHHYSYNESSDREIYRVRVQQALDAALTKALEEKDEKLIAKIKLTAIFAEHMIDPTGVANGEISLEGIYGEIATIAAPLLDSYLSIQEYDAQFRGWTYEHGEQLKGLLQELTFLMLANYRQEPYKFALPTTFYEDAINPERSLRIDANHFRIHHGKLENRPVQVKSNPSRDKQYDRSIVIITGIDMGNTPTIRNTTDEEFLTLKATLAQINGTATNEQLDRIAIAHQTVNSLLLQSPATN